ncbi:MAG TPA: ABC transporter permease [Bacteroidia bacterium]|jgi:ABC-2 type transport system permease protein|nr:ABC transporter permease [Bacteroidia bacterium]
MRHAFIIGARVIAQLKGDKRFLALSLIAPLIIIYLLKLLFDVIAPAPVTPVSGFMPIPLPTFSASKFILPASAFIVHFLSFVLCAILLVQERTRGTLDRMLISGFRKISVISGYTIGYFGLATLQALLVITEANYLFDFNFPFKTIFILFLVIWLLAVVSVMLGIFVSTFARHEGHVFPFIPLIILPSVFLTGVIVDPEKLPALANLLGYLFPLRYANNIIVTLQQNTYGFSDLWPDFLILLGYAGALLLLASRTMKEKE